MTRSLGADKSSFYSYSRKNKVILLQKITYLFCDGLKYRFKVLKDRVKQATKDVVKSEI